MSTGGGHAAGRPGRGLPVRLLLLVGVLAACGGGDASPAAPPEILYGVDECAYCRMIVSDPHHAAVARSPEGEEARFDDLGCLAEFLQAAPDGTAWKAWVHPRGESEWRPAEEALYVLLPDLVTPMGSALAAFASDEQARQAAPEGADLLTWTELLAESRLSP